MPRLGATMSEDLIKDWTCEDVSGISRLQEACMLGDLTKVPRCVLTESCLLLGVNNKQTSYHFAAMSGCLNKLPLETLSEHCFLRPDNYGNTPLHEAAQHGNLLQVPTHILTRGNLLAVYNRAGPLLSVKNVPVLLAAARYGHLDQLPDVFEPDDFILEFDQWSAFDHANCWGHLHQLFGIDLPDICKSKVPEGWWEKKQTDTVC